MVMSRKRITLSDARDELKGDITAVRGELAGVRTELKNNVAQLHEEITATRRDLSLEIVRLQADVRDIKASMSTKADIDRVLSAVDAFAGRSRDQENAVLLHGRVLTDVQVSLKDHAHRIAALEARPDR